MLLRLLLMQLQRTEAEAAADVANAARRAADSIQKVAAKPVSAEAADNVAVAAEAATFRVVIAATRADAVDSTAAATAIAAAALKAATTSKASTGDTAITAAHRIAFLSKSSLVPTTTPVAQARGIGPSVREFAGVDNIHDEHASSPSPEGDVNT